MTYLGRAAVIIALLLAAVPSPAQPAADEAVARSDAQSWERALSLTDEFLVQLAMAKGLDPVKAEALRDLYQAHRARRRQTMHEAEAGRLTLRELRSATVRSREETDAAIRTLLTPAEIAWLDGDNARFHTAVWLKALDSKAKTDGDHGRVPLDVEKR
jgi:hypothetical protein